MLTEERLRELVERANAAYEAMTPSQKLRHDYEQRRSFAKGMCPWKRDFAEYSAEVDKLMPPESTLTDAQIGLALLGKMEHVGR